MLARYIPQYLRQPDTGLIAFPPVMFDWRYKSAFTKQGTPRKQLRRTNSQWRAVGWNYRRVMRFDTWADIGCPEPAPRVFGLTKAEERDLYSC